MSRVEPYEAVPAPSGYSGTTSAAVPQRQRYAAAARPRSWVRAVWARFWVLLVVVPVFWLGVAAVVAVVGAAVSAWVWWVGFDSVSPVWDVATEGAEPSSYTWGDAPLIAVTLLVGCAAWTCLFAAVLSPFATVAVDAVEAREQNPFVLVVEAFKTFLRAWLGLFVFWLLVSVVLSIAAWVASALGVALHGLLVTADVSMLLILSTIGFGLVALALFLKTVFITVNAAREAPAFEPALRRAPLWVLSLGALWLLPVLSVALIVRGLFAEETPAWLLAVVAVGVGAAILVVPVITPFVAADIFQDARRARRESSADWGDQAGTRGARCDAYTNLATQQAPPIRE